MIFQLKVSYNNEDRYSHPQLRRWQQKHHHPLPGVAFQRPRFLPQGVVREAARSACWWGDLGT
jgi:hypothetical protein